MSDRFDHTLERKLESKPGDDGEVGVVRRLELITGTGRRRRWSDDDKARIVIESLKPGANVSELARRHGMSPQQLFGWRREARALFAEDTGTATSAAPSDGMRAAWQLPAAQSRPETSPSFAPVVLTVAAAPDAAGAGALRSQGRADTGLIEIAVGDTIVRVIGQVAPDAITAVLRAVRRAS